MIGPNGLLWGFDWLASGPWWIVLLKFWIVTPGMMFLIAPLLESRWLTLDLRRQFHSFFPGDLILGIGVMLFVVSIRQSAVSKAWYDHAWVHLLVLATTIAVAILLTKGEIKSSSYPKRAMISPTKLYHNYVLYAGYGYVASMLLVQAITDVIISGKGWLSLGVLFLVAGLAFGGFWARLARKDDKLPPERKNLKFESSHVPDWKPVWTFIRRS